MTKHYPNVFVGNCITKNKINKIPIRHIKSAQKEPVFSENFSISDVGDLLAGNDMDQELHRHDFVHVLALENGTGNHQIDFSSYEICDHSLFFMRPGQVHQLILKAGSTGYLMEFKIDFYFPHDKASNQLLRKASNKNLYQLEANKFKKSLSMIDNYFSGIC